VDEDVQDETSIASISSEEDESGRPGSSHTVSEQSESITEPRLSPRSLGIKYSWIWMWI
jgi:hypothetical protein